MLVLEKYKKNKGFPYKPTHAVKINTPKSKSNFAFLYFYYQFCGDAMSFISLPRPFRAKNSQTRIGLTRFSVFDIQKQFNKHELTELLKVHFREEKFCNVLMVNTNFCRNFYVFANLCGILTQWSSYGVCSATCQSGLQAPIQQRTRSCVGATFGGNCNGALLVQHANCNVEVACPGSLTQWFQWGACSENCHSNPNVAPTRSRTRQCLGATFGGNCGGASLTMAGTCNVGIGCQAFINQNFISNKMLGQWSNWGAYGGCFETCQSNVNTAPTQSRRRTCNGGTFGTTCPGNGVDTRDCSVGIACPGSLTQWSGYGVCSATCQSGVQAPTQERTRSCVGATFGGNCNGALLVQNSDCNVEVACPGSLTQWFQWGACSENCHSNPNVMPTRSRFRQCLGATFGGNCGGASLTMTGTCNVGIGCQGQWSNWSGYGSCSETCHSNVNTPPNQFRTRTCVGGTFGTTCPGSGVDTRDCSVEVACPGILSQWSAYGTCSANCRLCFADPPPTQQRTRVCVGATFGGSCKGAALVETIDCNVDVACQALTLLPWAQWGACNENCQSNPNVSPTRTRTRQCGFFGESCNFTSACFTMTGACNVGVGCQGCKCLIKILNFEFHHRILNDEIVKITRK
ncbi:adhesion G protein-coupled receptor B1-like [Hydractinia symbiolongicarpus]|uniref:adhesion G protein-coupled receptor B1-like n=1 Tax=Hydractinia symbiolongicarpus TaxID=13093 RepID=UPI00254B6D28|nr:adhesion G protein-coupled receptor B1-like [Hydractinia symbiolongicarpus]